MESSKNQGKPIQMDDFAQRYPTHGMTYIQMYHFIITILLNFYIVLTAHLPCAISVQDVARVLKDLAGNFLSNCLNCWGNLILSLIPLPLL